MKFINLLFLPILLISASPIPQEASTEAPAATTNIPINIGSTIDMSSLTEGLNAIQNAMNNANMEVNLNDINSSVTNIFNSLQENMNSNQQFDMESFNSALADSFNAIKSAMGSQGSNIDLSSIQNSITENLNSIQEAANSSQGGQLDMNAINTAINEGVQSIQESFNTQMNENLENINASLTEGTKAIQEALKNSPINVDLSNIENITNTIQETLKNSIPAAPVISNTPAATPAQAPADEE